MNILIATQTYDLYLNGQGTFTVHLAEGLAARGHQVSVLCPSQLGHPIHLITNNVDVYGLKSFSFAPVYEDVHVTLFPNSEVDDLMNIIRPQVVHIQDHYPLCRSVLEATCKKRLPAIGTNHFLPENIIPHIPLIPASSLIEHFLEQINWKLVLDIYNQLDFVTAPTETAAQILRDQGIKPKVGVVSCGVDLERYHPNPVINRKQLRQKYGLDVNDILFLYVGRVDKEKQLPILLKAMVQLNQPGVQVGVAGKGSYLSHLKKLAEQLSLEEQVVFTGFIPGEDLPALLNSADIFVMPSTAELQSIATLQALASGLPVIAADARALPEIVLDGEDGLLFHPNDAEDLASKMAVLAQQPEKRKEMGEVSLEIAHHHQLNESIKQYEKIYIRAAQVHHPL